MLGTASTTVSSSSTKSRWTGSGSTGCCGPNGIMLLFAIALPLFLERSLFVDAVQLVVIVQIHALYLHAEQLRGLVLL